MKKVVRLLVIFVLMVSIPSFSYAKTYNKNEISNGSYVIGSYLFNNQKTTNYNGTLTTPIIMLASKSLSGTNVNDMIIYYKNSRGKWVNAINNQTITNVPNTFEITCVNLDCQNIYPATTESFIPRLNSAIGNGSYIIGAYEFNNQKTANYNGTLTTQMIMLAAKSIQSTNLNDMVIYFKNSRGKWVNAINNQSITSVPQSFNISYINLEKQGTDKQDDEILIIKKSINYTGQEISALVNIKSGLEPIIDYYSDSTCQTKMNSLPINAGKYYINVTTPGNNEYNAAQSGCSEAVEIKKIDATCPTVFGYTGSYDKKAHTILVSDALNGSIEYKTDGEWSSLKPERTDAGTTTVYVHVKGNSNYNDVECGSKDITINKVQDIVSVLTSSYKYDGTEKTPFMNSVSGLPIVSSYYTDDKCTIATTTQQANSVGGAPYAIGKYYVKASTDGDQNYLAAEPGCWEAVVIGQDKFDDEIFVHYYDVGKPYTGLGVSTTFETTSGLNPTLTYYTDNTCQIMTNSTNAGSQVEGGEPVYVGTYYVTATTSGSEDYNATTLACTKAIKVTPREVEISTPTLVDDTLTYNGSAQLISNEEGGCSVGGTMYYYTKDYTSLTAPTFNTTDWSTTFPDIQVTDASTYYLWYYCRVTDTTNNTGTNINTPLYVTKEIAKADNPMTITDNQNLDVIYSTNNQTKSFVLAENNEGNVVYSIKSQKNGNNNVSYFNITNNDLSIASSTPVGTYNIVITAETAGNNNYNGISKDFNITFIVSKIDDEINITAKEYDYDGNNKAAEFTTTSGLDPIVTYYSDSTCQTVATPKNAGIYYATATTAGNSIYNASLLNCSKAVTINQREVTVTAPTVNSSTLTYNGNDQIITAAAGSCTTGGTMYYYTKNYTSTSAPTFNTTDWSTTYPVAKVTNAGTYYIWYYCNVTDTTNNKGTDINKAKSVSKAIGKANNPISVTATQSWSPSYSTSAQEKTFEAATNAQGNVTYSIKSQKKGSTTVTNFSIGTNTTNKLTMAANTEAGTYTVVITATAAGNTNYKLGSKDITMTVTINKLDDQISITSTTFEYDGTAKTAEFTTTSGLTPTVTYYSNSTCTTTATPNNAGTYYATATTAGNDTYNAATLTCNKAVTISKKASTLTLRNNSGSTYKTDDISVTILTDSDGELSCSSLNETSATCTISDNKLVVTPVATVDNVHDDINVTIKVNQAAGTNFKKGSDTYTLTLTNYSSYKGNQICEQVKDNETIDYENFTSVISHYYKVNGVKDDYYAIYEAHKCANKYNKEVLVSANKKYNIFKYTTTGKLKPITVQTSTDLNNSIIKIHDEGYTYTEDNNNHIYKIFTDENVLKGTDISNYEDFDDFVDNVFNINKFKNANSVYVQIKNANSTPDKVFIRTGENSDAGEPKSDSFKIERGDTKNTIKNRLFWDKSDYNFKNNSIESIIISEIPDEQIIFKNAKFVTIVNTSGNLTKKDLKRGISIRSNNTLIDNINHYYVKSDSENDNDILDEKIPYGYGGFFAFTNSSDIIFTNSKIHATACSQANSTSSYDLSINDVVFITIDNVEMQNFSNVADNQNPQMVSSDVWGAFSSNRSKNIVISNSKFNRIDAHRGIYILKITDSVIGQGNIELTGAGVSNDNKVTITRVKVVGTNKFVTLRGDFGSTWNGEINIKDSSIEPLSTQDSISIIRFRPLPFNSNGNLYLHNFGYDLYIPSVVINGFKVVDSNNNIRNDLSNLYVIGVQDYSYNDIKNLTIYPNENGLQTHYTLSSSSDINNVQPTWTYINRNVSA